MTSELLRATPFHARAAEANRRNAWVNRGGFTLASAYGEPHDEALAARFGAVLADVSWHWRALIFGPRANEFVARLFTRDATQLAFGTALEVLWLNDAGGVRGAGTVAHLGRDLFHLVSAVDDAAWIADAAALYDVTVRDATLDEGMLALVGPTSIKVLEAAGLDTNVVPFALQRSTWRGLEITVSRLGYGYEMWCEPDDALIVWDRLMVAGRPFALCPAGHAAMDILDLENGTPRPGRDYQPARDGFSPLPSPQSLGLAGLVDRKHVFNGRAGFLAAGPDKVLAGILFDSDTSAPHTALSRNGLPVGRTLGSLYSPALRRAIALAVLAADGPGPGTELTAGAVVCRTCALPFLPIPAPISATTENPPPAV